MDAKKKAYIKEFLQKIANDEDVAIGVSIRIASEVVQQTYNIVLSNNNLVKEYLTKPRNDEQLNKDRILKALYFYTKVPVISLIQYINLADLKNIQWEFNVWQILNTHYKKLGLDKDVIAND